jgi:hypothetical protein
MDRVRQKKTPAPKGTEVNSPAPGIPDLQEPQAQEIGRHYLL